MKEEYKEFVGIYDESVPVKLCNGFVESYEEAKKNRTITDLKMENNEMGFTDIYNALDKTDEAMFVMPLTSSVYPRPPVETYFQFLNQCFIQYLARYSITFGAPLYNDVFKIHKVRKSEGFHSWHYEKANPAQMDRIMAYMTYLEVPEKGGETEFLHQSLRIDPVVGRTLIWPAGFTHVHRGLMPLEGEKMYITGWFHCGRVDFEDAGL